jgi:hypothetical protein
MKKAVFITTTLFCMVLMSNVANAGSYTIDDYFFVWHVAKEGSAKVDVQKSPEGVFMVLSGPGGRLARLDIVPAQAEAISEVLNETGAHYDEQMKKQHPNMSKAVSAGDYTVTFSSSRGKNFQVDVRKSAAGALVSMNKEQALKIAPYLKDSQKLAQIVNERIKP